MRQLCSTADLIIIDYGIYLNKDAFITVCLNASCCCCWLLTWLCTCWNWSPYLNSLRVWAQVRFSRKKKKKVLLSSTNACRLLGFIKFHCRDNVQAKLWCTELFITKQHSLEGFHVYKPGILELDQISNHISVCYI